MAVWLVRAGSHGEFEQKFIQDERIYVTWEDLDKNIEKLADKESLFSLLDSMHPDSKPKRLHNWVSQIWPFAHEMAIGDLVVVPLKSQSVIYFGEITGPYQFEPEGPNPYYHWRSVKWVGEAIPRSHFGQDLLYTFGAFLTICRVQRNNAEKRIEAMRQNDWKAEKKADVISSSMEPYTNGSSESINLEELARDQIAKIIEAKFKGHSLTRLVEAILKAQGYTTYRSPEGADGGADILAGAGPLGFGEPRLCIEVKSESTPIDRPTVDKLLGAVTKFGANEGLFVSWSGFKSTVPKELAASFFRVRLWSQKDLIEQLLANYDKLDEDLQAELPLKRIWTITLPEDD
ncbi:restriction endonuclease [Pseudodesulfovibrio sp. JC047]|uniref:restriction endonuclease n=1 Tax=Pseudodesulfovibrio sp. JC047 TaxID=2683199 RepID=UPI0013D79ADC|nr:restriction endonuclease [Pseudodesulfovibrio sp. JC047]NDV20378.1 restriction endonuclease [Pseudodesulfovibrio sp. JC047]